MSFKIPKGRFARNGKLGAMATVMAGRLAAAKVRAAAAAEEKKSEIMEAFHLKSAEEMVRAMGAMKGAVMKIGQMASFVTDDVPPQYQKILQKLQTSSDPMEFDRVREVVEAELGMPLEEAFTSFEEEALAAASIGQVHRAVLPTGEDVVVKVQYPGVDAAIRSDLSNLSWAKPVFRMMMPGLDPEPMLDELRTRLVEELDYTREAANQNAFARLYSGHPLVNVPRAFVSHCSDRVLTSEFVEGHNYEWLLDQPEEVRLRAGELMFRFVFSSIFEHHALNGDPHPGNYLFHEDGRVTFIDFGCVRYYEPNFIEQWVALILSHLDGNEDEFLERVRSIGFFDEEPTVPREMLIEFFGMFYEPFRYDREFTFTSAYTAGTLKQSFASDSPFKPLMKQVDLPPQFVFVNRIQWGLYAILTKIGARGNFYQMHMEATRPGTQPTTEVGRTTKAFRAKWKAERDIEPEALVWIADGKLYTAMSRTDEPTEILA